MAVDDNHTEGQRALVRCRAALRDVIKEQVRDARVLSVWL